MVTNAKHTEKQLRVKRYRIQYPVSDYKFPSEARIRQARVDEKYLHVELVDGRMLSVPLSWIPTLKNASAADRNKFEINQDRTMIVWDPEKCAINDEIRITDYLGPS